MGIRLLGRLPGSALVLLIFSVIGLFAQTGGNSNVTLSPAAAPGTAEPGVTLVNVTGSGFPTGTITPNLVTVSLVPSGSGPAQTATVTAVTTVLGSTRRVTFQVTAGHPVTSPTTYLVSLTGATSTGATFSSTNTASLTINPPAAFTINPTSGQAGLNIPIVITGNFTNFAQGSTTANFGAGIIIVSLTVSSPTAAIVAINISLTATPGPRTVTLTTGSEIALLLNGFTVLGPTPSITQVNPNTGSQGQQGLAVSITGTSTHFAQGTTANFGTGITVASLSVNSPTSASALLNIDPAATLGNHDVTLTTGSEIATLLNGFTVQKGTPVITLVSPSTGQQGQPNLAVTITSQFTHFAQGTTQVSFGSDITINSVTVASATSLTVNITIPLTASKGDHTVTVTTGSEVVSKGFTVEPGPPMITLTSPANLSFLNLSPTTVNGTVSDPTAIVSVNSIQAPVSNGAFSIALPLAEGPNIITATATTAAGVSTASITVTLDTTPPHVTITSPPDQFVTTDASISVAGSINDIVVGTVNPQQATVSVNGVAAQVANRTFLATNIPLTIGSNVIQATGRDQAANAATTQITVVRQTPPQAPQIKLISGNNQTGTIGSVLAAPLLVALTDSTGNPVTNTSVIFKVTQNNGIVASGGLPASSVVATTNAQGQAQAQWTLGMRAGAGGNTVEAYAVGFSGTAIFSATGNQGAAGNIVIDSGNNQFGVIGQALPKPLIAVVIDAGNNRLANVPVTFTVVQGGGTLTGASSTNFTLQQNGAGQTSITASTDSDGRVAATLTLGLQEGNANNLVTADFAGDQGFPASFTASGRATGNAANTTITGVVLDNSNLPIPGVTIRALLTNVMNSNGTAVNSAASTQTNAQGQFTISQAPVGFVNLMVDGSTAQRTGTYPSLNYDIVTIAGQNNTLEKPVYLLPLNPANQLCVTAMTGGGTLTIPEAPGFSLTFGPGQVTFPGNTQQGCVSVTVVHPDKVPMTPGFGQQPRFIVTIQPTGAIFNPPAPITLPNVDGLAPRSVTEMYSFDHDIGSFVAIGTATVSDDGQVIRSNQGVGVLKAGWHCGGNTASSGAAATCPVCFFCPGSLANCQPQGNGTSCGNGGTCQFQKGCVCPPGQVFNPTTGSCVNNGPCSPGFTLNNGLCCQGTTCVQPCSPGLTFNPTTGTCVNNGPCPSGYALSGSQCCPPTGACFPPSCPPGEIFDPLTQSCQTVLNNCTPQTAGQFCNAGGGISSPGRCDASGNCVGSNSGQCGASSGCSACTTTGGTQRCTQCPNGQPPVNGQCCTNGQCPNSPTVQIYVNGTATPTDDITLLNPQQPLPIQITVNGGSGVPVQVQLSVSPAGRAVLSTSSVTLSDNGGTTIVTATPLGRSLAANDVVVTASINGSAVGTASFTVVDIMLNPQNPGHIRAADTPATMPDRIPPTVSTTIPVSIQPDLSTSGQVVTLIAEGTTNQLNGVFNILGPISMYTTTDVPLQGITQTDPSISQMNPGAAGNLKLAVLVRGQIALESQGFFVAAIPTGISESFFQYVVTFSPDANLYTFLNHPVGNVPQQQRGIVVLASIASDSGDPKDLDQVSFMEQIQPDPSNPPTGYLAGGVNVQKTPITIYVPGKTNIDTHSVGGHVLFDIGDPFNLARISTGRAIFEQTHVFFDKRTGGATPPPIPISNSGYEISNEIVESNGQFFFNVSKIGKDTTANNFHSAAGATSGTLVGNNLPFAPTP